MDENLHFHFKIPDKPSPIFRHLMGLLFALFFTCLQSFAQDTSVSGKVTDNNNEPLPGVNVLIKGTTQGTVTDIDGNYKLSVPQQDATLVFSFIGYLDQEVAINGRSTVDVSLEEDVTELEEVVVIGYGTQKKRDLTGSVASVKSDELTKVPTQNALQSLQGKVTGVQVTSNSGAPGSAPVIRIRGVGTLNESSPLFVVDGVLLREPDELNFLNPGDIESVEILKDASATAIYGARGANGVMIITTKSGTQEKTQINVNTSYGLQIIPNEIDLLNGPQFAQLANEIAPGTYDPASVANIDWQDEVFDDPAGMATTDISFSGKKDQVSYYVGLGYFYQDGVIPNSNYERFTLKLNNTYSLDKSENVQFGHNITVARFREKVDPGVIPLLFRARPTDPPRDADGNLLEVEPSNPFGPLEFSDNETKGVQIVGNVFGQVKFLENFIAKSSFGVSTNFNRNVNFTPEFFVSAVQQNQTADISKRIQDDVRWFWENTINYNKDFANHHIDGVIGFTLQEERFEFLRGFTEGLIRGVEELRFIDVGQVDEEEADNNGEQSSLVSYLFRVNYNYMGRYLITLTGRADGSSKFSEDNQFGFFPAVGVGWNISEEPFMQNNALVSNLKLRASWGILGNDRIGSEARFIRIGTGFDAVLGPTENLNPGATIDISSNEDLRWEETTQWDVGLEAQLIEGRLSTEVDYYNRLSEDILIPVLTPGVLGNGPFRPIVFNTASVRNTGFEFKLDWNDEKGDFTYGIGFLGTTVNNEVEELGSTVGVNSFISGGSLGNGQTVTRTEVGNEAGAFFGFEIEGVFQDQGEVDNSATLGTQQPGDFKFKDQMADIDGDGELDPPDGVIDENDRVFIGSPIPDFLYGFNVNLGFKGLSLGLDFQGQIGNDIYNGKRAIRFELSNYQEQWLDRWTGPGTSNSVPRAVSGGSNFEPSEFFIEDGSFLRLRTITLGYNFASGLLENLGLTNAKIYLRGTNVFTIDDFTGYTPEIGGDNPLSSGIDLGVYPVTSIYTAGLNVSF